MKRLVLIAMLATLAGCARVPLATYTCYKTVDKIAIDGVLNEESWQKAASTGDFSIWDGKTKSPLATSAKMVWDSENLYIAFECEDPDLYSTLKNKDEALYTQDVVEVFVMEQSLGASDFVEYEVSILGTLFDCYLRVPYVGFLEWSSPFKAATKFTGTLNDPKDKDTGYTVEMAIPFSDFSLRKPWNKADWKNLTPKNGDSITLNLYRIEYSTPEKLGETGTKPEYITWSPLLTRPSFHMPERFGIVTFVDKPVGPRVVVLDK